MMVWSAGSGGAPARGGTPSGRRRLTVAQRQREIISATLRLLGTTPADQVSIDDIAEAAGASRALIYHYFRTKEQLYVTAVRSACDDLKSRLALPDVHPFEQVRHAARSYVAFAEDRSADFVALLRGAGRGGPPDELAAIVEDTRQFIVDLVISSLGVAHPAPVLRATVRGWVAMMEVISLEWLERRALTRDQVGRLLMNQLGAALMVTAVEDEELSRIFLELVASADQDLLPPWVRGLGRPPQG